MLRAAIMLALVTAALVSAPAEAAEATLRLRIAWGGGNERQWHGSVELSDGTLTELMPLGIEADEPGSIWLDGAKVLIRQRSGRAYDGIDVLATADLSAKLTVRLWPVGEESETKRIDMGLKQLAEQSYTTAIDTRGNQLLVIRSPGDKLRVTFRRSSLVFAPGEAFSGLLEPHLLGLPPNTALRVKAQLSGPGGGKGWAKEYDAVTPPAEGESAASIPIDFKLPEPEGVYDLTLTAINASLRDRLPWKRPVAERKVQLVIVGDKPSRAPLSESQTPVRVVEIDPANSRSWEKFASLMSNGRKDALGSGDVARWDHPTLGPLVQLGSTKEATGWEAYPLPINNPGQPHILEIEYPSDVPQTLSISLVEPNAAGAVMPIGLDSGLYVSDEDAGSTPELLKHRIVFWPKTKMPIVLVTNRRPSARAVFGKLRVLSISATRRRALGWPDASTAVLGRAFAKDAPPGGRMIAGYLDRPLFSENFSAPESLDAFSHRSLDDWNTFYQGAMRLIEYLNYAGYNGLMLTVMADGSTIYPSRQLDPTPRHDTGVFFANGQDPLRKDVLELLFRLFDREGLALTPALQFSSPLVELERWRHESDTVPDGLEWIGPDGTSRAARARIRQGLGPYYNPLNPRVQQAMLGVVSELVDRYGAHPSFAGVGIQLSADGYAQLPGGDGSYDDDTIARFEIEAKVRVPATGPSRFNERARQLSGPASREWFRWRADNLSELYRRMGQVIVGARKDARLYLAGGTMFASPGARRSLRPALPRRMRLDEVLLSLGLKPDDFQDDPVVFLRPQQVEPMDSLSAHAVDLELNLAPEVDRLFSGNAAASLFYHEPQKLRLAAFDAKSPFGSANTYTWLVSQCSPSGFRNRERFVHSLATLDAQAMFDGGWLLPLGQEESIRDLVSVYRELPAGPFEAVAGETQPVAMRSRVQDDQTFVYLVNDSPWSVTVTTSVDMPPDCRIERLGNSRGSAPVVHGAEGAVWELTLRPYDLVGARFSSAKVRLEKPKVVVAGNIENVLERRIRDLSARAAALASPPPLAVLENPGYELPLASDALAGWTLAEAAGNSHELDTAQKHTGTQSLKLKTTGAATTLRSNLFAAPATGRLSVSLWLRVEDRQHQPSVRLALEGRHDEGQYYRFATVGGGGPNAVALSTEWSQYIFQVDDLPGEGLADFRVRFDLSGPGETWIDDVELFDLAFSPNERVELTKIIGLADLKLKSGQLADCARLLDGYWPHFLVTNVPLTQTPASVASEAPRPRRERVDTARKPGMMDQMRGYLPRWWQ
jgi:hypothetical protein